MRKRHIILLGILGSALCLRLYRLSWRILICDELSSVLWWIDLNFLGKLIRSAIIEPSPPLYFIILHSWIKLFGATELSIRFLSVLLGLFSIIILYLIGKELITIRAGIVGTLLMAISPYHIFYTTYARMYALLLFLTLLSYYSFIKLTQSLGGDYQGQRKWLGLYILSTALSLYTHYSALYAILVQNIYFFIFWKDYKKISRLWVKAQLGVIFCFLPLLPLFLKDLFFSEWALKTYTPVTLLDKIRTINDIVVGYFMPYLGGSYFDNTFDYFYRWRLLKWIVHPLFLIPFINRLMSASFTIFFISGIIYLFKNKKRFTFISLYLFLIFFFLLFFARYNRARFFFQVAPAFYLIVACGLLSYRGKIKALSIGIVILFHFLALNAYYAQIKISPVKSAFACLQTAYQKGDIILINTCDVRNLGTNFWYHNKFQNNNAFDIRLLVIPPKAAPPKDKTAISPPHTYGKIKQRFKPVLERLKTSCGYQNVESIYRVIRLDDLDREKRIWYVGVEYQPFLGKDNEIIALLEKKYFNLVALKSFEVTQLYLLEK